MSETIFDDLMLSAPAIPEIDTALEFNEQGDAQLFAALAEGAYIYDPVGQWYKFQSPAWVPVEREALYHIIGRQVAQEYANQALRLFQAGDKAATEKAKEYFSRATGLRSKRRATAVIDWSQPLMLLPQPWDKAPMQVCAENGVIDLVTGELRDARPGEYLRASTSTPWRGLDEPAPLWEKTVSQIFGEDAEMIGFVQRLFGYALTGRSNERVLPILYGVGANGKTTLKEAIIATIGGSYFQETSADALMETKHGDGGRGPNPLIVSLQGKRFLWASESKEGARLDMGLVKSLTGGDTMSGRGMYAKQIVTFRPSHTPFLITNHLPHISADDQAAWDRILPIEFCQRFTDNPAPGEYQKIPNLKEKLQIETSGILAWLVRGCIEYQKIGLRVPASVLKKCGEYREAEDDFGMFVSEALDTSFPAAKIASSVAFVCYSDWAIKYKMPVMSRTAFGRRMGSRFQKERTNSGIVYTGVKIK